MYTQFLKQSPEIKTTHQVLQTSQQSSAMPHLLLQLKKRQITQNTTIQVLLKPALEMFLPSQLNRGGGKKPSLGHASPTECCRFAGKAISNTPSRNNRMRLTPADINKSAEKKKKTQLLFYLAVSRTVHKQGYFLPQRAKRYLTAEVKGRAMPADCMQSITVLSCPKAHRCTSHCLLLSLLFLSPSPLSGTNKV